LLYIILI